MINICNEITRICTDEKTNAENLLESLDYITNVAKFLDRIKVSVSLKSLEFYPTFKGRYCSEKLGILSSEKEQEMKVFKVKSPMFLVDDIKDHIKDSMKDICEEINFIDEIGIFYLI